ncbi:hypothetical protein SpAn4DRAFT_0722 [Sporomusa ovata]|uniref:Uncharacterized protein n=1 Tax=Sporomusa ovata TaxID=2378 RepID=A0A0U1L3M2_9FIRM|nr:hypothetical protein SpAn4DRAFT_0722 [Sporomusa ovata]
MMLLILIVFLGYVRALHTTAFLQQVIITGCRELMNIILKILSYSGRQITGTLWGQVIG